MINEFHSKSSNISDLYVIPSSLNEVGRVLYSGELCAHCCSVLQKHDYATDGQPPLGEALSRDWLHEAGFAGTDNASFNLPVPLRLLISPNIKGLSLEFQTLSSPLGLPDTSGDRELI